MDLRNINPDELHLVLRELHDLRHESELNTDHCTVNDIVEVTGADEERVIEILQRLRHEDREAKIVKALAEMEAPLYSVERPSTAPTPDPLHRVLWNRTEQAQSILRDAEAREKGRLRKKRLSPPTRQDMLVQNILLVLFLIGLIATVVWGVIQLGTR